MDKITKDSAYQDVCKFMSNFYSYDLSGLNLSQDPSGSFYFTNSSVSNLEFYGTPNFVDGGLLSLEFYYEDQLLASTPKEFESLTISEYKSLMENFVNGIVLDTTEVEGLNHEHYNIPVILEEVFNSKLKESKSELDSSYVDDSFECFRIRWLF